MIPREYTEGGIEVISMDGILGLRHQEAPALGRRRFAARQSRPTEGLEWTRLTVDEWRHVVPPVAAAFQAQRAPWRRDGQPRTARRDRTDQPCPVPPPEDRRRCRVVDRKTSPLPVVQGRRCGRGQSPAVDSGPRGGPVRDAADVGRGPMPVRARVGPAPWGAAADATAPGGHEGPVIASCPSAVRCRTFGCVFCPSNPWFHRTNSIHDTDARSNPWPGRPGCIGDPRRGRVPAQY
jgi:hypothetical protein